jgi:hypothetical protein
MYLTTYVISKFDAALYNKRQIKSRRMMWAGHVARMGDGRNVYGVLVGKPEGKIPLERPRRRWEHGIRMDLREIYWRRCGVDAPG